MHGTTAYVLFINRSDFATNTCSVSRESFGFVFLNLDGIFTHAGRPGRFQNLSLGCHFHDFETLPETCRLLFFLAIFSAKRYFSPMNVKCFNQGIFGSDYQSEAAGIALLRRRGRQNVT